MTFQLDIIFDSTANLEAFERKLELKGYEDFVRSADDSDEKEATWKLSFYRTSESECTQLIDNLKEELYEFDCKTKILSYSSDVWTGAWESDFSNLEVEDYLFCSPESSPLTSKKIIKVDDKAFGTGEHATTKASLILLEKLSKKFPGMKDGFLDVGTGTGIFTAWAELEGFKRVIGTDIIEEAIHSATRTKELNKLSYEVVFDSFPSKVDHYDFVACNILPPELYNVFSDIIKRMRNNSILVIAGFNESNLDQVTSECSKAGFKVFEKVSERGWVALALRLS